jgi:membrane protease subunit HflC
MTKGMNLLVLAGLILAIVLNSIFVIDEKEDGIVFQFGEAIKSDLPTGLNFKLPIVQNVKKYDARLQTLDEEPNRILTVESKYLIVDSFVKYRITDVRVFYDATSGAKSDPAKVLSFKSHLFIKMGLFEIIGGVGNCSSS